MIKKLQANLPELGVGEAVGFGCQFEIALSLLRFQPSLSPVVPEFSKIF